jgi:hypothetical protein
MPSHRPRPNEPPAPSRPRDHRIDVFRGTALLMIVWTHLGWDMAGGGGAPFRLTPGAWGLSDAAEIFVYLSGFVYGLAYARVFRTGGLLAAYRKSALRAWQLYAVNLLTFALVAALCAAVYLRLGPRLAEVIPFADVFFADPLVGLSRAPLLAFDLPYFDILTLYVKLLLLAPILFAALARRWWLGLGLSAALYGLAHLGVGLGPEYFNTLAWQLLFTLGMAFSIHGWRLPRHPALLAAAVALLAGVATAIRVMHPLALRGLVPDIGWLEIIPLADKPTLHPLRLAHFASLAYVVHYVTQPTGAVWAGRLTAPLRMAGRHSLGVFAFGIVATYAGVYATHIFETGQSGAVLTAMLACLASLGFARVLEWKERPRSAGRRLGPEWKLPVGIPPGYAHPLEAEVEEAVVLSLTNGGSPPPAGAEA